MKPYRCVETFVHDRRAYAKGQRPVWFSPDTGDALKRKGLLQDFKVATPDPTATTFVCLASGPSLTTEDCDTVKLWQEIGAVMVIAVNLTFRRAPFADYVYAMDHEWWKTYGAEVEKGCRGRRVAPHAIPGTEYRHIVAGNSGAGAIMLAAELGAKRIILVGYDAQHTGGFAHWHEDYPKTMGNAGSSKKWPAQFASLVKSLPPGVEVINASRETALKVWPRMTLEEVAPA